VNQGGVGFFGTPRNELLSETRLVGPFIGLAVAIIIEIAKSPVARVSVVALIPASLAKSAKEFGRARTPSGV